MSKLSSKTVTLHLDQKDEPFENNSTLKYHIIGEMGCEAWPALMRDIYIHLVLASVLLC